MLIQIIADGACRNQGKKLPDGSAVLGAGAIGVVILKNSSGPPWDKNKIQIIGQYARALGPTTNNQAEYEAVIAGLLMCAAADLRDPIVYSDSTLVVNQVNRIWRCEDEKLRPLLLSVWDIQDEFRSRIVWVPRKEVQLADSLANSFLDRYNEARLDTTSTVELVNCHTCDGTGYVPLAKGTESSGE